MPAPPNVTESAHGNNDASHAMEPTRHRPLQCVAAVRRSSLSLGSIAVLVLHAFQFRRMYRRCMHPVTS